MSDFSNIIEEINTNLPDNTTQSITAKKLRDTLIDLTNTIEEQQNDFEEGIDSTLNEFVVDRLDSISATKALSANQGRILNNKITEIQTMILEQFIESGDDNFYKNGTINSSGTYNAAASANKIYLYPVFAGQQITVHLNGGSVSYAALSWTTSIDPIETAATINMIMMTVAQDAYYSYTAPENGYALVCITSGYKGYVKVHSPSELEKFGVYEYTYGTNAAKEYVGTSVSDSSKWGTGFFNDNGEVTGSGYYYTKNYMKIFPGKFAQAGMTFSGNARLCYYDENYSLLGVFSTGNATATKIMTLPEGAAFFRFCQSNTTTNRISFIYQNEGEQIVAVPEIDALEESVENIEQTLASVDSSIDNNLLNELNKTKNWLITADGSTYSDSNYGQPAVRYRIPVDSTKPILHIRFKFKQSGRFLTSSSYDQDICMVGSSNKYHACLRQNTPNYASNIQLLNHRQFFVVGSGSSIDSLTLDDTERKEIRGEIAFTLEYKGTAYSTAANYTLVVTNTSISVKNGSETLETFTFEDSEELCDVIDYVNTNSSYLKAVFYQADGLTLSDLLLTGGAGVPLCASTSTSRPWYFAKKVDNSWHWFEAILDYDNRISYTNIDGLTVKHNLPDSTYNKYVFIGGLTGSSTIPVTRILCRDLHIGYSYEDAEIITYPNNVSGNVERMISDTSPYLMIFEGHSIDVTMDKNMPVSSDMAASTDSLRRIFSYLKGKCFVPVNWKDVIDWKKGQKLLPKRSYTLMFDDFQIENFIDLGKRKPFTEFEVKPGLAIITGLNGETRSRSEQVTVDGHTWTLGEIFDAMERAGWHPCSHTKNHTVMNNTNVPDSNLLDFCKECIYSCDKLGIYDKILVYPTGSTNTFKKNLMTVSGFEIGIQVSVNGYNCLNSLDFNFIRNEIGCRKDIDNILAQIV